MGPAAGRARRRVRRRRGRLRLPHRDAQYAPGLVGSALPFTTAQRHKEHDGEGPLRRDVHRAAARPRPRPRRRSTRTARRSSYYDLTDELDIRNTHRAIEAQVRLHEAAGAREIPPLAPARALRWRAGDDLDAFIARWQRVPLRAGGFRLFCAHQMGTCRMGKDPQTSVADPWGELHDTPGVWIGDGSAFPTSSGTNPMISIMALAHRTAGAIAAEHHPRPGKPPANPSPRTDKEHRHGSSRRDSRSATSSTSAASGSTPPASETIDVDQRRHRGGHGPHPAGHAGGRRPRGRGRARRVRVVVADAARGARRTWSAAIAAGLAARSEEIAAMIAQEVGMPIGLSKVIQAGLPTMTFASVPDLARGRRVARRRSATRSSCASRSASSARSRRGTTRCTRSRRRSRPALAAGCTVVLKPSEVAPLNAFILAEIIDEVGPAGRRVQPRHRARARSSARRSPSHPDVDMVSFTGSTRAGRARQRARRADREAGRARARRQVAERDPRRRRPRDGGRRRRRRSAT